MRACVTWHGARTCPIGGRRLKKNSPVKRRSAGSADGRASTRAACLRPSAINQPRRLDAFSPLVPIITYFLVSESSLAQAVRSLDCQYQRAAIHCDRARKKNLHLRQCTGDQRPSRRSTKSSKSDSPHVTLYAPCSDRHDSRADATTRSRGAKSPQSRSTTKCSRTRTSCRPTIRGLRAASSVRSANSGVPAWEAVRQKPLTT